jgi:hypothetical protein
MAVVASLSGMIMGTTSSRSSFSMLLSSGGSMDDLVMDKIEFSRVAVWR